MIYIYIYIYIWLNYNGLTATSLESWLYNKGNHPQMALIHVSELLLFTQVYYIYNVIKITSCVIPCILSLAMWVSLSRTSK